MGLGVISSAELEAMEQEQSASTPVPIATPTKSAIPPHNSSSILVSAGGDGDHTSINEALRVAARGAQLLVRPGLYRESLVINSPVEIIGDGAREEIIITSTNASCILMRADEATIRGAWRHLKR